MGSSRAADEILQTASLTKVATALVVLNNCTPKQLKRKVTVSATAAKVKQGTHAKLRAGDHLSITELLYGLMLPSGNDAAEALAEHVGKKLLLGDKKHHQQHNLHQHSIATFADSVGSDGCGAGAATELENN